MKLKQLVLILKAALLVFPVIALGNINDFDKTSNKVISGYNHTVLHDKTPAQCAAACTSDQNKSWCLSFDYKRSSGTCDLSRASAKNSYQRLTTSSTYDNYDIITPPQISGFKRNINQFIPNYNYKTLYNKTPAQCAAACTNDQNKSWCVSFDYNKPGKKCDLSRASQQHSYQRLSKGSEYDNYDIITPPQVSGFKRNINQFIPNYNYKTLYNKTPAQCAATCTNDQNKSWCVSFDYNKADKKCDLSRASQQHSYQDLSKDSEYDNYDIIDVPQVAGFSRGVNLHIPDHNIVTLRDKSVEQCASICTSSQNRGWCLSFDYHKDEQKCDLSDKSPWHTMASTDSSMKYDNYTVITPPAINGYQRTANTYIKASKTHGSFLPKTASLEQCADACTSDKHKSWCVGFNYKRSERTCVLTASADSDDFKGSRSYDNYTAIKDPRDFKITDFSKTKKAYVSGHNIKTLSSTTPEQCASACTNQENRSWCVSFDYHVYDNKCDLSDKGATHTNTALTLNNGDYDNYEVNPRVNDFQVVGFTKTTNKAIEGHNLSDISASNPEQCAAKCRLNKQCVSFDFKKYENSCYLGDIRSTDAGSKFKTDHDYDSYDMNQRHQPIANISCVYSGDMVSCQTLNNVVIQSISLTHGTTFKHSTHSSGGSYNLKIPSHVDISQADISVNYGDAILASDKLANLISPKSYVIHKTRNISDTETYSFEDFRDEQWIDGNDFWSYNDIGLLHVRGVDDRYAAVPKVLFHDALGCMPNERDLFYPYMHDGDMINIFKYDADNEAVCFIFGEDGFKDLRALDIYDRNYDDIILGGPYGKILYLKTARLSNEDLANRPLLISADIDRRGKSYQAVLKFDRERLQSDEITHFYNQKAVQVESVKGIHVPSVMNVALFPANAKTTQGDDLVADYLIKEYNGHHDDNCYINPNDHVIMVPISCDDPSNPSYDHASGHVSKRSAGMYFKSGLADEFTSLLADKRLWTTVIPYLDYFFQAHENYAAQVDFLEEVKSSAIASEVQALSDNACYMKPAFLQSESLRPLVRDFVYIPNAGFQNLKSSVSAWKEYLLYGRHDLQQLVSSASNDSLIAKELLNNLKRLETDKDFAENVFKATFLNDVELVSGKDPIDFFTEVIPTVLKQFKSVVLVNDYDMGGRLSAFVSDEKNGVILMSRSTINKTYIAVNAYAEELGHALDYYVRKNRNKLTTVHKIIIDGVRLGDDDYWDKDFCETRPDGCHSIDDIGDTRFDEGGRFRNAMLMKKMFHAEYFYTQNAKIQAPVYSYDDRYFLNGQIIETSPVTAELIPTDMLNTTFNDTSVTSAGLFGNTAPSSLNPASVSRYNQTNVFRSDLTTPTFMDPATGANSTDTSATNSSGLKYSVNFGLSSVLQFPLIMADHIKTSGIDGNEDGSIKFCDGLLKQFISKRYKMVKPRYGIGITINYFGARIISGNFNGSDTEILKPDLVPSIKLSLHNETFFVKNIPEAKIAGQEKNVLENTFEGTVSAKYAVFPTSTVGDDYSPVIGSSSTAAYFLRFWGTATDLKGPLKKLYLSQNLGFKGITEFAKVVPFGTIGHTYKNNKAIPILGEQAVAAIANGVISSYLYPQYYVKKAYAKYLESVNADRYEYENVLIQKAAAGTTQVPTITYCSSQGLQFSTIDLPNIVDSSLQTVLNNIKASSFEDYANEASYKSIFPAISDVLNRAVFTDLGAIGTQLSIDVAAGIINTQTTTPYNVKYGGGVVFGGYGSHYSSTNQMNNSCFDQSIKSTGAKVFNLQQLNHMIFSSAVSSN